MSPDCLKLKIWSLQCKFSELAEKYMNNMLLGISCPEQLDYLKTFRRALLMLNRNNSGLLKTIPYTATGFGKFIAGVTSYTVTYKDTNGNIQSVVIDGDNLTATFCAVEDSVSNTPANTPTNGVNYIVSTEACDEGCSSIDDATLNQILETLEKKY